MEDTKTSYFCHWNSPLGGITMASDGTYLTGLWFDGQKHFGSTLSPDSSETVLNIFHTTILWLEKYFQGECPPESVPIRMIGTDYQKSVWRALLEIPYGSTVTYGELAKSLEITSGRRTSARAVGNAVGRNPVSILIPCHRVIGAGGSLTGYAAGTDRKQALLRLERTKCAISMESGSISGGN